MKIEKKAQRRPIVVGSARSQTKGDIMGNTAEPVIGGLYFP